MNAEEVTKAVIVTAGQIYAYIKKEFDRWLLGIILPAATAKLRPPEDLLCWCVQSAEHTVVADAGEEGKQAAALRVTGDKAMFYKVRVLGSQDTRNDGTGSHYFYQCHIQGSVDFIFGNAKSLYHATITFIFLFNPFSVYKKICTQCWSDVLCKQHHRTVISAQTQRDSAPLQLTIEVKRMTILVSPLWTVTSEEHERFTWGELGESAKVFFYDNNDQAVSVVLGNAGRETWKPTSEIVDNYIEILVLTMRCLPSPNCNIYIIGQAHKFRVKVSEYNFSGKTQTVTVLNCLCSSFTTFNNSPPPQTPTCRQI